VHRLLQKRWRRSRKTEAIKHNGPGDLNYARRGWDSIDGSKTGVPEQGSTSASGGVCGFAREKRKTPLHTPAYETEKARGEKKNNLMGNCGKTL